MLGGATDAEAHAQGRAAADNGRYLPGSSQFNSAYNEIIANPD